MKIAPEYGKDCDEDIIKFVNSYVACKADSDDLSDLVNLRRHKRPKTMILEPLSEAEMLKEAWGQIQSLLNSINADEAMTFVEFLQ